jgi:hypothetical protein
MIPFDGNDYENKGGKGPTAQGLLNAITAFSRVRKGLTPLGTPDPKIYATMVRNAVAVTEQVSVDRTANDMIRFLTRIRERHFNDALTFDNGVAAGRSVYQASPWIREHMRGFTAGAPFQWTYLRAKQFEEVIYEHHGPEGFSNGLVNFLSGFHQVVRMGHLGRWSLLYHTADANNNHFVEYLQYLISHREDLRNAPGFIQELEAARLHMSELAVQLDLLEKSLAEIKDTLSHAINVTLRAQLKDQIAWRLSELTIKQDELISRIFKLMGFLEGIITPENELRPRTLEKLGLLDKGFHGAFIPGIGMIVASWFSWIGALVYVGVIIFQDRLRLWKNREALYQLSPLTFAENLGKAWAQVQAEDPQLSSQLSTHPLLAPVVDLGVRDLGRLRRSQERRGVWFETYVRLMSRQARASVHLTNHVIQAKDMNVIIPAEASVEDLQREIRSYLTSEHGRKAENKIFLNGSNEAHRAELEALFPGLVFVNVSEISDLPAVLKTAHGLMPEHINVLLASADNLPVAFLEALSLLNKSEGDYQNRILLILLSHGLASERGVLLRLGEMVTFADIVESQA